MRELPVVCAILLALAVVNVQSGAIYRRGRESQPLAEVQQKEIVSELRKDTALPVEVDVVQPVVVIKEEVLVPVETLRNVEPIVEVAEPVAVISNIDQAQDQVRGDNAIVDREDKEIAEAVEQQEPLAALIPADDDGLRIESEDAVVQEQETPVELVATDEAYPILKQGADQSTVRPTLLQQAQQIITNPFNQFIDTIRRPSTKSPDTELSATVEATTNANIFQQLQAGVQSIGNQITSAFNPNTANLEAAESAPPQSSVRPPNFFETLQTNFQNTVGGIFRPNGDAPAAGATPQQGPFQTVLSNVQNFLNGNRGETNGQITNSPNQPPKVQAVDDKVDFSKNSGEVAEDVGEESVQPAQPLIELLPINAQKVDDSVLLVTNDTSLENESE